MMSCRTSNEIVKNLLMIASLLIVASCAPATVKRSPVADPVTAIVWPGPPQEPRIRYLYSLSEPIDIGIKPGIFKRLVQVLAGKEAQGMLRPYAVAADDKIICVVDPGLRIVHLYMTKRSEYKVIRAAGSENFVSPVGIGLGQDAIYIADSVAGKIFVFDRQGEHKTTISGLMRPTGIALHAESRRLYVADTLGNQIVIFDDQGVRLSAFGSRGTAIGQFNYPTSVALRGDTLFVNDTMNFRIQAFTLGGSPVSHFGEIGDGSGQFALSKGLGVDEQGHVYVADGLSNYIQIFDQEGRFLLSFGGMGGAAGQFMLPTGIHIVGNTIFVADSQNHRVQVFEYVGSGN
jgi:DNA-binding beta-propeller fold protein YncE